MTDITDHDLIDFLLGRSSPEKAEKIRHACQVDSSLAAQLEIMAGLSGLPLPAESSGRPLPNPRGRRRRLFLIVASLFCLFGAGYATWGILRPHPLLEDNFNDGWLDSRLWRTERRSVFEEFGHVRLVNRGSLKTMEEFKGPFEIRFRWRWNDHAGDQLYAENLNIVLRTTGQHKPAYPFEIENGIAVQLHGWGGTVKLIKQGQAPLVESDEGSSPFPAGKWHNIRITDDGENIEVFVSGPSIDTKYKTEPILRGKRPDPPKGHHISLYNRELVGGVVHESLIDDFVISGLPERAKGSGP